jgi:hypothetical protein
MKATNKEMIARVSMPIGLLLTLLGVCPTGFTSDAKEGLMVVGVSIIGVSYLHDIVRRRRLLFETEKKND